MKAKHISHLGKSRYYVKRQFGPNGKVYNPQGFLIVKTWKPLFDKKYDFIGWDRS